MASFDDVPSAMTWLHDHVYSTCCQPIASHDITEWVHSTLSGRKMPCVWALSDPYLRLPLALWCGNNNREAVAALQRHVLFEPMQNVLHHRRLRHVDGQNATKKIGLRAPSCLSIQRRMAITRRVEKGWMHSTRHERPVLVLSEYAWIHLTHPIDIKDYRVQLIAPKGWVSAQDLMAMHSSTSVVHEEEDKTVATLALQSNSAVIHHLEKNLSTDELSVLRDMLLVPVEQAYKCIKEMYGGENVAELLNAHFEVVQNGEGCGDEVPPPTHIRLQQQKRRTRRHGSNTCYTLTPVPTLTNDWSPYDRLLHTLRFVYCSAAYKIRYATANPECLRLVLPFGPWVPLVERGPNGYQQTVHPYGWPVVVQVDPYATLPYIAWWSDKNTCQDNNPITELPLGSGVRELQLLMQSSIHTSTVHDVINGDVLADVGVAVLTLGAHGIHGEQSVGHQCLVLVVLLLITGPLCCLDEAVSVASLVMDVLVGDNRTFGPHNLDELAHLHERAWLQHWGIDDDTTDYPLHPCRADASQAVQTLLLHDERDRIAFCCAQMPEISRPKPRQHRRKRGPKDPVKWMHRRRAASDDLARLQRANRMIQRMIATGGVVTHTKNKTKKERPARFRHAVCVTEDALKYRVACRQQQLRATWC